MESHIRPVSFGTIEPLCEGCDERDASVRFRSGSGCSWCGDCARIASVEAEKPPAGVGATASPEVQAADAVVNRAFGDQLFRTMMPHEALAFALDVIAEYRLNRGQS